MNKVSEFAIFAQKWSKITLLKKKHFCGSLQTILLYIEGELAGGGSVAMAVGDSEF